MTDRTDDVRARLDHAEDITPMEMPDEMAGVPRNGPGTPSYGEDPLGAGDLPPPRTPDDEAREGEDPPLDPIMAASEQPLNDYGNGQRFVIHFGEDVMFVPRVGWFTWTGMVWEKDPDELGVRKKAQQIWALIEKEAQFIQPTKRERKLLEEKRGLLEREVELEGLDVTERTENHDAELSTLRQRLKTIESIVKSHESMIGRRLTHAKNAGNSGPLGHMLSESQTSLAVPFEKLDRMPLDINTMSGLMRFRVSDCRDEGGGNVASFELLPHARDQLQSKIVPVRFDLEASSQTFDAFLLRVMPDREMREFLKRFFGLCMTGVKVQKFAFFYGSGANGKSVLMDLIGRILDGYSASMRVESLTGSNRRQGADATPDLIPLLGARFVRTSEPDQGEKLQESLIKQLTGGEPIPVRPNYGEQIIMDAFFKLVMGGNHKPSVHGADDGIWRRVMLVPFEVQIPESERDESLGEKLWAERDGVFKWMVEGLMDYLEVGLQIPQCVLDATEEYREDSDPIGSFLTKCCAITGMASDSILSKDLCDAFNYYLMERGETMWKPTTFTRQVATKSKQWKHPETGLKFVKSKASLSQYSGIQFSTAFKDRFKSAPRDMSGRITGVSEIASSAGYTPDEDGFSPI